nr:NADH dehydrogenase subunit 6 [Neohydatothrips samayunkur]
MKMFTIFCFMCLSFNLMFLVHPLMIGMLVMMQAMITSLALTSFMSFSWFSFIIFMIYLGGILMIFSYIISITFSLEKLFSKMPSMIYILSLIISFFFSISNQNFFLSKKIFINESLLGSYSYSCNTSIFLLTLLLLIMVLVVFIIESSKNSMRPLI